MKKRNGAAMTMARARNAYGICASVKEHRLYETHVSEGEGECGGEDEVEQVACRLEGHIGLWAVYRCNGVSWSKCADCCCCDSVRRRSSVGPLAFKNADVLREWE